MGDDSYAYPPYAGNNASNLLQIS